MKMLRIIRTGREFTEPLGDRRAWAGGLLLASAVLVTLSIPATSLALPVFGPQQYLNSDWATDGNAEDGGVDLATDGAGTWIAVWHSNSTLGGTIGTDADILYAVSSDDGVTWSAPAALNTDAVGDTYSDSLPAIGYDDAGTWIAVWTRLNGGVGLQVARSTDSGATWSGPSTINPTATAEPAMEVAGSTVVVIASTLDDLGGTVGNDRDLIYFRSADSGVTWSPLAVLNTAAATDQADQEDIRPDLATDGAGNWIAVWEMEDSGDSSIFQAVSTDDGATWGATTDMSGLAGGVDDRSPAIATDGAGRWIVTWDTFSNPGFLPAGTSLDVLFAISDDLGSTWTQARIANSTATAPVSGAAEFSGIATDGAGNWIVGWREIALGAPYKSGRKDVDLFFARSVDNGATWSEAAVLNSNGADDGEFHDSKVVLRYGGTGTWVAVWEIFIDLISPEVGEDLDLMFARAEDQCPASPASGCLGTTTPGRSRVLLASKGGNSSKLSWKTSRVEETLPADIGDPTASSSFLMCIYDGESGGDRLVFERMIPAGAVCKGEPCWTAVSDGYKYKDSRLENGPVKSMDIRAGAAGDARYRITAKGERLGLPSLPFEVATPVLVQLTSLDSGTCWDAAFSSPATSNSAEQFKGRSD